MTTNFALQEQRLYSILWLYNGREEWEDYIGSYQGLVRYVKATISQGLADCVIRVEQGEDQ
jgi:hypothetical protein